MLQCFPSLLTEIAATLLNSYPTSYHISNWQYVPNDLPQEKFEPLVNFCLPKGFPVAQAKMRAGWESSLLVFQIGFFRGMFSICSACPSQLIRGQFLRQSDGEDVIQYGIFKDACQNSCVPGHQFLMNQLENPMVTGRNILCACWVWHWEAVCGIRCPRIMPNSHITASENSESGALSDQIHCCVH